MVRRLACCLALVAFTLTAAPAGAWELPFVDLKVGLRGGANISLLANPPDADALYNYGYTVNDEERFTSFVPYADYMGVGWNAGVALNARVANIIGLEVGYQRATESARGTIELPDVRDCRFAPQNRCFRQEVEQEFSRVAHHLPLVVQASFPIGVARPFLSVGVDLVLSRTDRAYAVNARSPLPDQLNPGDAADAAVLDAWENSPRAQNVLRAGLNPDTPNFYGGFIAGAGLNIALRKIEIPVEFRFHLYPATGASLSQRGQFGSPCPTQLARTGACGNPIDRPAPLYDDIWTTQFFVLFGLDYLLF
jgi:hypothetical protein